MAGESGPLEFTPEAFLDVTPEEFARIVRAAGDEDVRTVVRGVGTPRVLERIFRGMEERFVPEKARGVRAVILFVVVDGEDEHQYSVTVREGSCSIVPGRTEDPTTTLRMELVDFVRLMAGQVSGAVLYISGKLKVTGHPMVAAGVSAYFRPPEP